MSLGGTGCWSASADWDKMSGTGKTIRHRERVKHNDEPGHFHLWPRQADGAGRAVDTTCTKAASKSQASHRYMGFVGRFSITPNATNGPMTT